MIFYTEPNTEVKYISVCIEVSQLREKLCLPGTLKEMTSCSRPASWAFLAKVCDRRANSSCSDLDTPNAAARRSALWPIVSDVENSATAGSYTHMIKGYWKKC